MITTLIGALSAKARNELMDNIMQGMAPSQVWQVSDFKPTTTEISANVLTEVEISEALLRGDVHMEFMDEAPSTLPLREIVSFGFYNGRKVRLRGVDAGKIAITEEAFAAYTARINAYAAKVEVAKAETETMSQKIKRWMW
jgi:hypothetical protein